MSETRTPGEIVDAWYCCGSVDVPTVLREALEALCVEDWGESRRALKAFEARNFLTRGAAHTFYHRMHDFGLEEHGGSVPGWATAEGHAVLEFLRMAAA